MKRFSLYTSSSEGSRTSNGLLDVQRISRNLWKSMPPAECCIFMCKSFGGYAKAKITIQDIFSASVTSWASHLSKPLLALQSHDPPKYTPKLMFGIIRGSRERTRTTKISPLFSYVLITKLPQQHPILPQAIPVDISSPGETRLTAM
jgi:hypothetical protein